MKIDYRKLCIELFGTDDVAQLKKIAQKAKDNRNAGRKRKFSEKECAEMERLLEGGATIQSVAARFNTSRQVISRYANRPPEDGYTMRMTFMYQQQPCTVIDIDFLNEKVLIKNRTDDILHRAFGAVKQPTWQQFEEFLKDRCFPETRGNLKSILRDMGLDSYDPLQIIEKTGGKTVDDPMWIKFKYYPRKEGRKCNTSI